jgi:hypothetical protein
MLWSSERFEPPEAAAAVCQEMLLTCMLHLLMNCTLAATGREQLQLSLCIYCLCGFAALLWLHLCCVAVLCAATSSSYHSVPCTTAAADDERAPAPMQPGSQPQLLDPHLQNFSSCLPACCSCHLARQAGCTLRGHLQGLMSLWLPFSAASSKQIQHISLSVSAACKSNRRVSSVQNRVRNAKQKLWASSIKGSSARQAYHLNDCYVAPRSCKTVLLPA